MLAMASSEASKLENETKPYPFDKLLSSRAICERISDLSNKQSQGLKIPLEPQ